MKYETKRVEVKATVVDEAEGIVEALINTMDAVDYSDDIMPSGIFDRSLAKKSRLPYVEGIDHQGVAGKTLETKQRGDQQWARMQFNLKTQAGRDTFWHVAAGDVDEWSVKWLTLGRHFEQKDGRRVRVLDDIDWVAFGPVIEAASPGTGTLSVKAKAAFAGALCPYCDPEADPGSTDPDDCTCDADCGADDCQAEAVSEKARGRDLSTKKIAEKDDAPKSPPKGYPTDANKYGDPTNFKYPLDEGHIKAAVSYFNHDGAQAKGSYTDAEWASIGKRIATAANTLIGDGHSYNAQAKRIDTEPASDGAKTRRGRLEAKWFSHLEGSYEDLIDDLSRLLAQSIGMGFGGYAPYDYLSSVSVLATFDGYCIAEMPNRQSGQDSSYLRCEYTIDNNGEPVLGDCSPVDLTFTATSAASEQASRRAPYTRSVASGRAYGTKAGKRNSVSDTEHMQQAHDHMIAANPEINCSPDQMPGRKSRGAMSDSSADEWETLHLRTRLLEVEPAWTTN